MKKLLLGSTALVVGGATALVVGGAAPASAADPIRMGVGGYFTGYIIGGRIDSDYALDGSFVNYKGIETIYEGEIHFIGSTKLDNGTSVGLTVELEAHNPNQAGGAAQIDEAFLFAFGDWGRIEFGSRDAASYRMFYGTPSALIGFGFFQHNHQFHGNPLANNKAIRAGYAAAITSQWQDVNRINYFTPRFAGLQIGGGYAPKLQTVGGQGAGACGYNQGVNPNNCPIQDYSYQDVVDIGANYLNKFGDITVALHAAYAYTRFEPGFRPQASASNLNTGFNRHNWHQWVVGAQFGFAGFTVGASHGRDNNGLGRNYYTGVDNDTRYYTAGGMYETGPWQISAGWMGSRNTNGNGSLFVTSFATGTSAQTLAAGSQAQSFGTNPNTGALSFGQESSDKFEIGANYALGPGVKLVGGALYFNSSGPSNAVNGNSWALLFGLDLRF